MTPNHDLSRLPARCPDLDFCPPPARRNGAVIGSVAVVAVAATPAATFVAPVAPVAVNCIAVIPPERTSPGRVRDFSVPDEFRIGEDDSGRTWTLSAGLVGGVS